MQKSGVQVAIANGRIEGLQFERHQAFLGIPFAAPRLQTCGLTGRFRVRQ